MHRLESVQGRLIKQNLGLTKLPYNIALPKALDIEKVVAIVNEIVLSLYNRRCTVENPSRRLIYCIRLHLWSRFILYC